MSDILLDDPCVLFALRAESRAFLQEFRPQQRFAGAPCWARFCGPAWLSVLVLHTGIGPASMTRALEWLLDSPRMGDLPYRPRVVLSAGYAGALQEGFSVGDILLATDVVDAKGNSRTASWPEKPLQGEWRPVLHRGRLLSLDRLVASPEEKRELGRRFAAQAVDMESAVLADLCGRRGVPFGCVRAISDEVQTALSPRLMDLLSGSRVSLRRTATALVRSPGLIGELWSLFRKARRASEQLGKALGELLTLTLPWSEELEKS